MTLGDRRRQRAERARCRRPARPRPGLDVTVLEAADTIGGGTRSSEMIVPGLVHDHCSAFHPIAAGVAVPRRLDLAAHGLPWLQPEVDCVHPLDDGSAGVLHRSIDRTAEALGDDGDRWRRLFEPLAEHFDDLLADATQPVLRVPRHPLLMARFGARRRSCRPPRSHGSWQTDEAKALWAGVAAHALYRLDRPLTSAVGLMLLVAGHARDGSSPRAGRRRSPTRSPPTLRQHGGSIETGRTRDVGRRPAPPTTC